MLKNFFPIPICQPSCYDWLLEALTTPTPNFSIMDGITIYPNMMSLLGSLKMTKKSLIIKFKKTIAMGLWVPFTIINYSLVSENFQIIEANFPKNPKTFKIGVEKRIV